MASPSAHVVDVTEATFVPEVIEASMGRPVVVDFWASWCGPCKTLGPILEGLAEASDGAFLLAKVDVDRNQYLAAQAGAQSIPTVLGFWRGQVVEHFVGALPKQEIEAWLGRLFQQAGLELPLAKEEAPSDPVAAEPFWQERLKKDKHDDEALVALGRLLLTQGRDEEAVPLLEAVEPSMPGYGAARAALQLRSLGAEVEEAGGVDALQARAEGNPGDPEVRYLLALDAATGGRFAAALEVLVELSGVAPKEVRDRARAAARSVLAAAGRDDEAIEELRRRLARTLF